MNWEAAEYEFRAAASLGSAEAQMYLGAVLGEEGRMDEALAAQRKAVELLPQDAEAHFLLGGGLEQSGDLPGAIQEFRQAAKLDPHWVDAPVNLGIALRQLGDLRRCLGRSTIRGQAGPVKYGCPLPTRFNLAPDGAMGRGRTSTLHCVAAK